MSTYEEVLALLEKDAPLTHEEEREVFSYYEKSKSNEIKHKIVLKNLGLISAIAQKYVSTNVEYEDLYQEGVLALYKAVDMFEYKRGYKFSTYAYKWLYNFIGRYVSNHSRTIRIPTNLYEEYRQISNAQSLYFETHGEDMSYEDIAKETGLTIERIREVLRVERLSGSSVALDSLIETDDGVAEINQVIEDPKATQTYEDVLYNIDMQEFWEKIRSILTEQEFNIICYRMGYSVDTPLSLDAVGKKYNITRERVRQIEVNAMKKLRQSKYGRTLRAYKCL